MCKGYEKCINGSKYVKTGCLKELVLVYFQLFGIQYVKIQCYYYQLSHFGFNLGNEGTIHQGGVISWRSFKNSFFEPY